MTEGKGNNTLTPISTPVLRAGFLASYSYSLTAPAYTTALQEKPTNVFALFPLLHTLGAAPKSPSSLPATKKLPQFGKHFDISGKLI